MEANGWNAARLIPATGIDGAEEQEPRATSALLSVMGAVPAFGRGAHRAARGAVRARSRRTSTSPSPSVPRPSWPRALIRVHHAPDMWTALVDVRAGDRTGDPQAAGRTSWTPRPGRGSTPSSRSAASRRPSRPRGRRAVRHLAWGRGGGGGRAPARHDLGPGAGVDPARARAVPGAPGVRRRRRWLDEGAGDREGPRRRRWCRRHADHRPDARAAGRGPDEADVAGARGRAAAATADRRARSARPRRSPSPRPWSGRRCRPSR